MHPEMIWSSPERVLVAVLGALSVSNAAEFRSTTPRVTLANGTYYGRYSAEYNQDHFLGMPFAQPPVGPLRFAAPHSLNASFTEPRNATQYGPECIGYGFDQWILGNRISEDCLTINVVRPSGVAAGDDLPVAVWIHGGVSGHLILSLHLNLV